MDDATIEDTVYRDFVNYVAKSVWVSSPEYAGWLTKRSSNWFVNNSLLFRNRAWQPKWVSLHGSELLYMDKEPLLDEKTEDLKIRRAQINGATVISSDEESNDPSGFVVIFNIDSMPNWHFRASSPEEKVNWMIKLSQVHAIISWLEQYERVKVLGIGGQGIVYELKHKITGKYCALKEIEIKSDKQLHLAIAESQFLTKIVETVAHPNVMQIQKVFQVGSKFYLVFPLCTGGELYEAVVERGTFTEFDAAKIVKQLVGALDALHQHDILHLDIKPENILFENPNADSKVLLTDFGLSKLFSEVSKDQDSDFDLPENRDKSYDEIMQTKLQRFMVSGDLNTDHLRGTYGYMSPELILTNTYSKATDVFAAGVVLYILLCGYPPFYSKSNRQTFVRTVKGMYKIEGEDWDAISKEGRDLVQRMLEKDPRKRISTKDILNHPWVKCVDEADQEKDVLPAPPSPHTVPAETTAPTLPSVPSVDPLSLLSNQMRRSSLRGSLSQLATHVKMSRSEKLATAVTKLASQFGGAGHSRLAEMYLKHHRHLHSISETGLPRIASSDTSTSSNSESQQDADATPFSPEQQLVMANPESRKAMSRALLTHFGSDDGKLSYEQLLLVRKYFGVAACASDQSPDVLGASPGKISKKETTPNTSSSSNAACKDLSFFNIGDMLLIRMIDRNNDGFVTRDDIVTTQVLMMQRHEQVLQAIFRIYIEAVWYPGKHINMLHAMQVASNVNPNLLQVQHTEEPPVSSPTAANNNISSASTDEKEKVNLIEPPRYITGKNVAVIFEKFGYSSSDGYKVFDALCATLQHLKHGRKPPTNPEDCIPEERESESLEEEDEEEEETEEEPHDSNIALHTFGSEPVVSKEILSSTSASNKSGKDSILDKFTKHSQAFAKLRQKTLFLSSSQGHYKRMDVNDFIRVTRIDDVLIQVLFRRTQETLFHFLQYCERKYQLALLQQQQRGASSKVAVDLESIMLDELRSHTRFVHTAIPPFPTPSKS